MPWATISIAEAAEALGLVTFAPDDIDWEDEVRIAIEARAALLARRAQRHGGFAPLRRAGDPGDQDLRPSLRLAELGYSSAPTPSAPDGALALYGSGVQPTFDRNRV